MTVRCSICGEVVDDFDQHLRYVHRRKKSDDWKPVRR